VPKNPSRKKAKAAAKAGRLEGCLEGETAAGGRKKSAAKAAMAEQIGLHLRSLYDDVLAQPVPGRFRDLLRQLERAAGARHGKDGM
jgi:hypothetical protein